MASNAIDKAHAAYKISVDLVVNGKTVPVVDAVVEFVLNQIPIARVVVPSGVTFNSNASGGSQLLDPQDLTGRKPAQLKVKGVGKPHPTGSKATPTAGVDTVLFDGYVLSSSADFSTTGVATTVVLVHWMYDLDLASFACGDFDKNAPDSWFTLQDSSLPAKEHAQPTYIGEGSVVADTQYVTSDWFKDIIKPAASYKASQPLSRFRSKAPSNNAAAVTALGKLTSKGKLKLNSKAASALALGPSTLVTHAINEMVGTVIFTGTGGSTIFEKLVTLTSAFGAVIAPRVDECLVMSYNPLGPVDVEIPDSECDFGGGSANPALLPMGAIMYGGGISSSIVNIDKSIIEDNFIGQYVAPLQGKVDGGPFIVFPTPDYLSSIHTSQAPDGQFKSKVGIVPATSPTPPKANNTQHSIPKGFADEIAKSHYFSKVFAAKTQDVLCGFRLDVAPGDCVKIYRAEGSASGANVSGLAKNWVKRGIVESVTYTLSASSSKIMTSYRLRHLMEKQDIDMFGISDKGEEAALFQNKPSNTESPLKKV